MYRFANTYIRFTLNRHWMISAVQIIMDMTVVVITIIIIIKHSYLSQFESLSISLYYLDSSFLRFNDDFFGILFVRVTYFLLCLLMFCLLVPFLCMYDSKFIEGKPPGRVHLGQIITAHHLYAFLKFREGQQCGGWHNQNHNQYRSL